MARRDRRTRRGAANAWSVLAADPERDLVFVPTGSAAPDYYGALRLGDNRYANSIVALQRHDGQRGVGVPDRASRSLGLRQCLAAGARHAHARRRRVPAVLQATKTGMLFVLDARTGAPVFPVEERAVPGERHSREEAVADAAVHGAHAAAQPASLRVDEVWGITDADRDACRAAIAALRNEGIFTPPSTQRHAGAAVEHRRRALGRRGRRSGAADRRRSGEPHRRDGAAHPARGFRPAARTQRSRAPRATTTNTT